MAVALAMLCASMLETFLPPALFRINNQNVGLLFMIACAFSAGRFGLLPGLSASGVSFLIVNYYFTLPYHFLKFNNITDTLNLLLFLSASVLISLFTSQTRGYAEKAAKRELNTQALFTLYRLASNASTRTQALEELQQKLANMLIMEVAFFLPPTPNADVVLPTTPQGITLSEYDAQALALCWKEIKTAGLASAFYGEAKWRFEPMIAPGGEIGVLGVRPNRAGQIDAWFGRLLTAIADQTAAVLEHIELERTMEATRIREEREKLRSMLLSSVSHDLKTPLSSIIGALSIYRSQGKKLSAEKQEMLIDTALQESERLDSFITNILDMTHLESGKIEFKQDWGDMHSIIQHVIKRLELRLRQHRVQLHLTPEKIDVLMDMMMIEQVLQNVLDNACKYTPAGTLIESHCSASDDAGFRCEVRDHGAGLPTAKLDRVFDKYARLQKQDSQVAGTGLGLAICKAMMEAQGGKITAANHPGGGAVFTLYLPQWRKADTTKYVA
jgi:two-component system sensor histidine kinase KdpD